MRKLLLSIITLGALLTPVFAAAQVSSQYWKLTAGTIQPSVGSWTFTLPYLPNRNCLGTDSNGLLQTGTCGSAGSTFSTTSISTLWPLSWNTATAVLSWLGLSTTSPWTNGNRAMVSGGNLTSVATGTITCAGTASCGAGSYVLGNNLTITGTTGTSASST